MPKKTDDIPSYAALGRALRVSRQRAHQLAHGQGWPFSRVPPWPESERDAIRRHVHARRRDNGYGESLPTPLNAVLPQYHPRDFDDPDCPLYLRSWIGDELDRVTPAALAELAGTVNAILSGPDSDDAKCDTIGRVAVRILADDLGFSVPQELL